MHIHVLSESANISNKWMKNISSINSSKRLNGWLWSNWHFSLLKGFYWQQYITHSIAKWIKGQACDQYNPNSNPAGTFVVTYWIEIFKYLFFLFPNCKFVPYLTYVHFIYHSNYIFEFHNQIIYCEIEWLFPGMLRKIYVWYN